LVLAWGAKTGLVKAIEKIKRMKDLGGQEKGESKGLTD